MSSWRCPFGSIITCFGGTGIAQAAVVTQGAVEAAVLLDGAGIGQEHAQDGNVLVVVLGLLNAIGANCFGLQMQTRLHARAQYINVSHD